jgi:hypothetical protein
VSTAFIVTIANHFEEVTDPRADRGLNYPQVEMIFVALCGTICDCNSWVDVNKFGTAKLASTASIGSQRARLWTRLHPG